MPGVAFPFTVRNAMLGTWVSKPFLVTDCQRDPEQVSQRASAALFYLTWRDGFLVLVCFMTLTPRSYPFSFSRQSLRGHSLHIFSSLPSTSRMAPLIPAFDRPLCLRVGSTNQPTPRKMLVMPTQPGQVDHITTVSLAAMLRARLFRAPSHLPLAELASGIEEPASASADAGPGSGPEGKRSEEQASSSLACAHHP